MLSVAIVFTLLSVLSPLEAAGCTAGLPATSTIESAVSNGLHTTNTTSGNITLEDGPYYTCLAGNNGTLLLSITVGYSLLLDDEDAPLTTDRLAHIMLECSNGGPDWVIDSVSSVDRNDTNTNCSVSSWCNHAGHNSSTDPHCTQACSTNTTWNQQCSSALYCAESDKPLCSNANCSDTVINSSSFTGNISRCICGVSCLAGYSFDSQSCTCYLTDICLADNPCDNNGSCTLDTTPDQYTCNCTGTGYTGTNCTVSRQESINTATPPSLFPSPSNCINDHDCIQCSPTSNNDCCMQCINGLTTPQHCVCPSDIIASTTSGNPSMMIKMSSGRKTESSDRFPLSSDITIVVAMVCLGVVVLLILTMFVLFICAIRYYAAGKRDHGNRSSDLVLMNNSTLPSRNGAMQSPSHDNSSFNTSNDYITSSTDYSVMISNEEAPARDGDNETDNFLYHFDPSLLKIVMDSLPEAYFNPMAAHYEMATLDNDSVSHHSLEHIKVNATNSHEDGNNEGSSHHEGSSRHHEDEINYYKDKRLLEQPLDQQQPTVQQAPLTDNDCTTPNHDIHMDNITMESEPDILHPPPLSPSLPDETNSQQLPSLDNNDNSNDIPQYGTPQYGTPPIVPAGGVSVL